jgi:type II secretory pathway component PulF
MKNASRQKLFDALKKVEAAGLPPDKALALLPTEGSAEQVLTLTALQKLLKQDLTLAEAAAKSGLFEQHEVGLIHVGERNGKLLEVYSWLARHYGSLNSRWLELHGKLKIMMVVWLAGSLFLRLYPLTTGYIGLGTYLIYVGVPAAVMLFCHGFYKQYANRSLPAYATEWLLKIPGLREQISQYHEAVFCHHLALALEAQLELPKAVSMAIEGIGNPRIRESFGTIASAADSGSTLTSAIQLSDAISRPAGSTAISTGEATGKLPENLQHHARQLANNNDGIT